MPISRMPNNDHSAHRRTCKIHDSDSRILRYNRYKLRCRAAVAQHADMLSTEVYVVPPARRMEHLALE